MLFLNNPPVMVTTVVSPHTTSAPPYSSASLSSKVPPAIVTLEPPKSKLFPEQNTWKTKTPGAAGEQKRKTWERTVGYQKGWWIYPCEA